jgi:hypothetical protein
MRRIATVAMAIALLGGAGAATASATTEQAGTQAGVQACHTWQYKIKFMTRVENNDGSLHIWAYAGNKFNSDTTQVGDYYLGNVYTNAGTFRGRGWVHTDALDYTQICW